MTPRRLLLLVAILANFAAFAAMGCFVAWWVPVGETLLATLLGLAVIARTFACYTRDIGDFLDSDGPPDGRLAAGLLLLAGGGLLFIPGPVSHLFGLLLLVPAVRHKVLALWRWHSYLGCPTTAFDSVREHQ